jgi:hypothetical protein
MMSSQSSSPLAEVMEALVQEVVKLGIRCRGHNLVDTSVAPPHIHQPQRPNRDEGTVQGIVPISWDAALPLAGKLKFKFALHSSPVSSACSLRDDRGGQPVFGTCFLLPSVRNPRRKVPCNTSVQATEASHMHHTEILVAPGTHGHPSLLFLLWVHCPWKVTFLQSQAPLAAPAPCSCRDHLLLVCVWSCAFACMFLCSSLATQS